jgi:uncharacterized repeat protein (TIGR01451 family)
MSRGGMRAALVALVLVGSLVVGQAPLAQGDVPPTVAITSPSSGAVLDGTRVDVSVFFRASANDPNEPTGNVTLVVLDLDGSRVGEYMNPPGTKEGTRSFGVDLSSVPAGGHTFRATAWQGSPAAGHAASAEVTVRIERPDRTPPTISARVEPAANAAGWHTTPPLVSFDAGDADSGLASVTPPVLVTTEGAGQVVTGTARDNAGNEASASATVNVDLTPPQLDVLAPLDGATVIGRSVVLRGSARDEISGLAAVTCDGAAADRADPDFSCALTLADGTNTITVSAVDVAGNESTATVGIRSIPPAAAPGAPPPPETADVSVTTTASPTTVTVGGTVTYTIVARNNGPAAASNVVVTSSLGSNVDLVSAASTQGGCAGSTTVSCTLGSLAPSASATITLVVRVRSAGQFLSSVGVGAVEADPNIANNVSSASVQVTEAPAVPPAAPPAPVQGQFAVARPVSGIVLVNGRPLSALGRIPIGARVNTKNGKVELRTTTGVGYFSAGEFRLQQAKARGAQAELKLLANIAKTCGKAAAKRALAATAAPPKGGQSAGSKKVVTRLWGQSKGARFKTTTRYSSATVRGTVWLVTERCDGSLTTVRQGRVEVRDLVKKKTVVLGPGQSYLAGPKAPQPKQK